MTEPHLDFAAGFVIPGRHARGRIARLGPALDAILAAHRYPKPIERLLAGAAVLAALFGSTLKEAGGRLTLQAQTEGGIVDLLVVDYQGGDLRGYVRHDPVRLADAAAAPTLATLLGKGYLAITFDQAATGERYQGIVPLEGASLAEAAESYFAQSEQIPSLVRIAVEDRGAEGHVAGGLLIQHLPEGEEGRDRIHTRLDHPEWGHVATLGGTIKPAELTDPALGPDQLLWRLFNEEAELRVLPQTDLAFRCRCDTDHFRAVIARFPLEEQAEMVGDDGVITVNCEYCARRHAITPSPAEA